MVTTYSYADGVTPVTAAEMPGIVDPFEGKVTGLLRGARTTRGAYDVAGSLNLRDDARRLGATVDFGLGSRASVWEYDGRSRLASQRLGHFTDEAGTSAPTTEGLTAADFRGARTSPSPFSNAQIASLGEDAWDVVPGSWTAADAAAHQLDERTLALGEIMRVADYAFSGGRRTTSGDWVAEYDVFDRLVSIESATLSRRIEYLYDPMDRMIGRTAWQAEPNGVKPAK